MGFPRPAPMKPHQINWGARFGLTGGLIAWTIGFWAVAEYYFDLFRPMKEQVASGIKGDLRYVKEHIRIADEAAMRDVEIKHGMDTTSAAQYREAKQRWGEAQLTNEVREFFMEPRNAESGGSSDSKDNFTNINEVKPGVYGKVIVTRSAEKEQKLDAAKEQVNKN